VLFIVSNNTINSAIENLDVKSKIDFFFGGHIAERFLEFLTKGLISICSNNHLSDFENVFIINLYCSYTIFTVRNSDECWNFSHYFFITKKCILVMLSGAFF
jgi:hypothetical protein